MGKHYLYRLILLMSLMQAAVLTHAQSAFNLSYDNDSTQDAAFSVVQTSDGGYIFGGLAADIFAGFVPIFIVKTDCMGDTIWTKIIKISSTGGDQLNSVLELEDGSYILGGDTQDTTLLTTDLYLLKLDNAGNQEWIQFYGGASNDHTFGSVVRATDGGFAISGYTTSFTSGDNDFYLVKTDSLGNFQWQKNYGGANEEICLSMNGTNNGGYILSGRTNSYGLGQYDLYMVKVDSVGNFQWQQTYGTSGSEGGGEAIQTLDGGYVFVGNIDPGGGILDGYIVKTDSTGNVEWDKTYGYADSDGLSQVRQLPDGSYVAAGSARPNSLVKTQGRLMKLDQNGDSLWTVLYGRNDTDLLDYIYDLQLTNDGGFVMCGQYQLGGLSSNPNFWLIKTDSLGCDSASCNYDCISCDFIMPNISSNIDTVYLANPVPVLFNDSNTIANEWYWDFGDGTLQSTLQNPVHIYDSLGTFTVTMAASYGLCSDTTNYTVVVLNDVGVESISSLSYYLGNYPNPFNAGTIIEAYVPSGFGNSELVVGNIVGKTVLYYTLKPGHNSIEVNSAELGYGTYFYSLVVDGRRIETKKMVSIR